ncbi:MAG TPA: hypothetical protein VFE47_25585 [Tepidisphaeraceae bacterium]|jgi:WD40 repeat protein|nr:hypothetical protein [Tepidisphaeraceae bacterium]
MPHSNRIAKILLSIAAICGFSILSTGCTICIWPPGAMQRQAPGLIGCLEYPWSPDIRAVEFTSNETLVSADNGGKVVFWDLKTGGIVSQIDDAGAIAEFAVPKSGKPVVGADLNDLCVLDPDNHRVLDATSTHLEPAVTAAISPDGRYVVCGGEGGDSGPGLAIYDAVTWKKIANPGDYRKSVRSVSISGDGSIFLSAGDDSDAVRVWAIPSGRLVSAFHLGFDGYEAVAISPDGKLGAALSSPAHKLKLFNVADGTILATLPTNGRSSRSMQFTPDSRRLVYADETVLRVWDIPSRHQVAAFMGGQSEIWCLSISPDGRTVATGSGVQSYSGWANDTVVRIYRLP